ncbi:hypothetical protein Tco_1212002 [Tanacetum coccineum]
MFLIKPTLLLLDDPSCSSIELIKKSSLVASVMRKEIALVLDSISFSLVNCANLEAFGRNYPGKRFLSVGNLQAGGAHEDKDEDMRKISY